LELNFIKTSLSVVEAKVHSSQITTTGEGGATVAEAIKLMRERKVSSLVVNRRTSIDARGIVTRKDVINKIVDPGGDPHEVKVYEIVSKPLVILSSGLALKY
jgi:CBS domain-containing protein